MTRTLDASPYDTDKGPTYIRNYDRFFQGMTDKPVRLLELGIRTGGSLLMWRDYFEHGIIAGLDSERVDLEDATGRVRIFQGLQQDAGALDRLGSALGPFDIIIDDASHIARFARVSFWHLFDQHLKPGGFYVIEDWGTGYWDVWPDGSRVQRSADGGHNAGMVGFVKELIDECGVGDITKPGCGAGDPRGSKFEGLFVFPGQVFVVKAHS
jgi:SAM-dependent methyltransferase